MGLTTADLDKIVLALRIVSPISFLSSALLIGLFLSIKKLQNVQNRAVYNTSWANLFGAAIWFFSKYGALAGDESFVCQGLATFMFFFGLADVFWLLSMTLNVYFVVIKKWALQDLMKVAKWYHLFAWGIPALCIFPLPFISTSERGRVLGDRYIWCSIKANYPEVFMAVFYFPAWFVFFIGLFCFLVIIKVIVGIKRNLRGVDVSTKSSRKLYSFLFVTALYLAQYFFLWFWPTLNRVIQAADPSFSSFFLTLMNGVAPATRGVFYLAIFCYGNRTVLARRLLPESLRASLNITEMEDSTQKSSGLSGGVSRSGLVPDKSIVYHMEDFSYDGQISNKSPMFAPQAPVTPVLGSQFARPGPNVSMPIQMQSYGYGQQQQQQQKQQQNDYGYGQPQQQQQGVFRQQTNDYSRM
ncbi:hypothetical protein BJ742DRAFT_781468 [Cladochytrium replicatum]|nr:hypothetical protein BJ742DRAFT_781468 [Cladochytrium replicatum]